MKKIIVSREVTLSEVAKIFEEFGLYLHEYDALDFTTLIVNKTQQYKDLSIKSIVKKYKQFLSNKDYSLLIEKIKKLFVFNMELEYDEFNIEELYDEDNDINKDSCFRGINRYSLIGLRDINAKLIKIFNNKKYIARFILIELDKFKIFGNFYIKNLNIDCMTIYKTMFGEAYKLYIESGNFKCNLPFYNNGDWYTNSKDINMFHVIEEMENKMVECAICNKYSKIKDISLEEVDDYQLVCKHCLNGEFECDICGVLFGNNEIKIIDGKRVCFLCEKRIKMKQIQANFGRGKNCNCELIHPHIVIRLNDDVYCGNCFPNRINGINIAYAYNLMLYHEDIINHYGKEKFIKLLNYIKKTYFEGDEIIIAFDTFLNSSYYDCYHDYQDDTENFIDDVFNFLKSI